jgi:hypothetical protein
MRNTIYKVAVLAVLAVILQGCVTPGPNMKLSEPDSVQVKASQDKALVYFIRPIALGFAVNAAVYDGDKFVGFVPYNQKLPYLANPGEHMFMVVSEAADFMKADLLPGKTYYAEVIPRMGAWRARFSLKPVSKGELQQSGMKQAINNARLIRNKKEAYDWAESNKGSALSKKEAYFVKWQEKPAEAQPFLKPEDGE